MDRIGRYQIESIIGRGSMGTVYLGYDPELCRQVAIKTLYLADEGLSEHDAMARRRFLREAQAAGRLSHPGIVTIYEISEDPETETPFIAMEYIPGRSLEQLVAVEGPLGAEDAVAIARDLADALEAAHETGIVHRDIKPANVLVREPDGAVKIADFGVARLPASELTRTDSPIGSLGYMAPEQLRGSVVDRRADVFSLGVVLYWLLCEERPFAGDEVGALTYAIVHEEPVPITRRRPELPAEFDRLFERALAKDPAKRFPTALAFRKALERCLEPRATEPQTTAPRRATAVPRASPQQLEPSRRRWLPYVIGSVFVLALLLVGVSFLSRDDRAATIEEASETEASPEVEESKITKAREAAAVVAEPAAPVVQTAHLDLVARSSIKSGALSVMIDGVEVYSRRLSVEDRGPRRFFKKMAGKSHETFQRRIEVPPGRHDILARVVVEGRSEPFEDRLSAWFREGEDVTVRLVAGRTIGKRVVLKLEES